MSDIPPDEVWQLYRQVLRERDAARVELDTLRLMTLEAVRERDEARALARECYTLLRRMVRTDGRLHQERWEEVDQLQDRFRPLEWLRETPALESGSDERCPRCGLRRPPDQPCPICGPPAE
jgi:hypothetical protein